MPAHVKSGAYTPYSYKLSVNFLHKEVYAGTWSLWNKLIPNAGDGDDVSRLGRVFLELFA